MDELAWYWQILVIFVGLAISFVAGTLMAALHNEEGR